jgi:hypothetical protein
VGVIVGGAVYVLVLPLIGSLTPRIGAVCVAGVATGVLSRIAVKSGKVLSPVIAALIGTFLGLLALYVMWVVFAYQFFHHALSIQMLVEDPIRFFRILRYLDRRGTVIYNNDVVKGTPLLICWLLEAGSVLGCAVGFAAKAVGSSKLACPKCGAECKQACQPARFAATSQDEMIGAVQSRDFASLISFPPRLNPDDPELSVRLVSCTRCGQTHMLTLSRIAWERDRNNKRAVVSKPLVNQLLISSEEAEYVKKLEGIGNLEPN